MTSRDESDQAESALYTTYPPLECAPARRIAVDPEAARTLERALAALPDPWRVLRSRRAFPSDGPPWVKYIALHPAHGIALVDFGTAGPETAMMPLVEFLAATGLTVSMRGDPPIVPVAAIGGENILPQLETGFASRPPCQVADGDWPELVVEELSLTPGLFLTEITAQHRSAIPAAPELPPEAMPAVPPPVAGIAAPPVEWVPDPALRMGLSALVDASHRRFYAKLAAKLAAGTLVGAAAAGILLAHTVPILRSGLPTPIAALPAAADVALVTDPDATLPLAQPDPDPEPQAVPVDLSGGDAIDPSLDDWPPPPPEVKPAVIRHIEAAQHRRRAGAERPTAGWPHWLVRLFNPPVQASRRRS